MLGNHTGNLVRMLYRCRNKHYPSSCYFRTLNTDMVVLIGRLFRGLEPYHIPHHPDSPFICTSSRWCTGRSARGEFRLARPPKASAGARIENSGTSALSHTCLFVRSAWQACSSSVSVSESLAMTSVLKHSSSSLLTGDTAGLSNQESLWVLEVGRLASVSYLHEAYPFRGHQPSSSSTILKLTGRQA